MNKDEEELARNCYGYGRWDAPYWFIGPEQGQGKWESDSVVDRTEAFRKLNKDGLCDCREFHIEIREERWHIKKEERRRSKTLILQRTWQRLMLLLMTYREKCTGEVFKDDEVLRTYQRERWGSSIGETCVIELSGLPARNFQVPVDRERFREERIEFICNKISFYKPKLIVMYGVRDLKHWEYIAGIKLKPGIPQERGSTIFLFVLHPVAHGPRRQDWIEWGRRLRASDATWVPD